MRRSLTLGALWLLAAVVAVVVAWQGVAVVGDQVTDERPAPLAASDIEARLADASTTTSTTTARSAAPDPASPTTTSTTSTTVGTSAPAPTAAMPPTGPPPPSTTVAGSGETRTYNLRGGTASLRFSPSGVEVVFANPAPGFRVEVEPEHGNGVKVEFESATHESRVDGWWDGGPRDRVREEPND